jgi:hypothetical protein
MRRVAVNRVLLYASVDKLKASESPPGWLERLDLRLTVGAPGASVTAGLRARDLKALRGMVDRADQAIRKEGTARSLANSTTGRPPALFTFEGPAGRLADSGVLWFAGVGDGVGFLLAGSAANAIARLSEQPGMFSPSADPVGTVQRFFESRADQGHDSDMAAYVWETLLSSTRQSGGLSAAPWVTGVAVYAGRIAIDPSSRHVEDSSAAAVRNLLIGSPMWVAQV